MSIEAVTNDGAGNQVNISRGTIGFQNGQTCSITPEQIDRVMDGIRRDASGNVLLTTNGQFDNAVTVTQDDVQCPPVPSGQRSGPAR